MNEKLEKKAYEIAKQYNTVMDYKAAMVALDNFVSDYPGTPFKEDALFYKYDSAYQIGINKSLNDMFYSEQKYKDKGLKIQEKIKKNLKVDLDSLLVTADADIIYNVHNTENDYEIIINAIVNCSDATFYMIKIDSSGKKISTDNVGPNHIFNTADSGHASYIYNHHCFS